MIKDIELKPSELGMIRWVIQKQLDSIARLILETSQEDVTMWCIEIGMDKHELHDYLSLRFQKYENLMSRPQEVFNLTTEEKAEFLTILINSSIKQNARRLRADVFTKFDRVNDFKQYYNPN